VKLPRATRHPMPPMRVQSVQDSLRSAGGTATAHSWPGECCAVARFRGPRGGRVRDGCPRLWHSCPFRGPEVGDWGTVARPCPPVPVGGRPEVGESATVARFEGRGVGECATDARDCGTVARFEARKWATVAQMPGCRRRRGRHRGPPGRRTPRPSHRAARTARPVPRGPHRAARTARPPHRAVVAATGRSRRGGGSSTSLHVGRQRPRCLCNHPACATLCTFRTRRFVARAGRKADLRPNPLHRGPCPLSCTITPRVGQNAAKTG
jgi:hypothetical protein